MLSSNSLNTSALIWLCWRVPSSDDELHKAGHQMVQTETHIRSTMTWKRIAVVQGEQNKNKKRKQKPTTAEWLWEGRLRVLAMAALRIEEYNKLISKYC